MVCRIRKQLEMRGTNLKTFIEPESRSVLGPKLKMRINFSWISNGVGGRLRKPAMFLYPEAFSLYTLTP